MIHGKLLRSFAEGLSREPPTS